MSIEIVCTYVHVRPPDCACAKVVGILLSLLVLQLLVQDMSQTQQESDRQARLERRRQLDREKRARETPDERNRRRSLLQSALLCSKADCDVAAVPSAVQSAGRCSVCRFAHARPTMPSISLVIIGASESEPLPC